MSKPVILPVRALEGDDPRENGEAVAIVENNDGNIAGVIMDWDEMFNAIQDVAKEHGGVCRVDLETDTVLESLPTDSNE